MNKNSGTCPTVGTLQHNDGSTVTFMLLLASPQLRRTNPAILARCDSVSVLELPQIHVLVSIKNATDVCPADQSCGFNQVF